MKLKGIDVSAWQGNIDWNKVKDQIDFTIIRAGYGDNIASQDDEYFKKNADECTRLGIPFGVYIYSYAMSVEQAESEADHVLRLIKGYKLNYPVYLDLEDEKTVGTLSNDKIAEITKVFCNAIENAGYLAGVYANTNWFNTRLTDNLYNRYTKWVAQYAEACTYRGSYDMWQYASDGRVEGANGNIDMNYCYKNFVLESDPSSNNQTQEVIANKEIYGPNPEIIWNNKYDPAILELQRILNRKGFNLVVDGIAGKNTYAACKNYTIHLNDKGELTKWVQDRLNSLGFNAGYADGLAEKPTMDGIARFQKYYGLGIGYLGGTDWYYLIR